VIGERFPQVVFSSVVRSTNKGESHGGLYLADLAAGRVRQVLDWSDASIDWEGRGGDRGLRGIAFRGTDVFVAASDEIFVYDSKLIQQRSFRNRYLRHCHEITTDGERLFMTSTGFDSVLEYDLGSDRFVRGYHLRFPSHWRARRKFHARPRARLWTYDPNSDDGPGEADSCHINNVFSEGGALYVSGTRMGTLWRIADGRLHRYARIPYATHNARPHGTGVLVNHTGTDRAAYLTRDGKIVRSFPVPAYDVGVLDHSELSRDKARPGFARGLTVAGGLVIGGSSPATVSAYDFETAERVASVNVTMDVRNAIHGLEVWPFDWPD
jgi:hypothetical protein